MKTTNLTVRVDAKLKEQAEQACAEIDLTLSQVVRAALRQVVAQRARFSLAPPLDTSGYGALNEGVGEAVALRLTAARRKRIAELEALERLNQLNRVSREELRRLRIEEVTR